MEEQEEPSEKFIKGFNAGYQMQQHEPELLDNIIKSDNGNNEYIQAMKSGGKQHQKEIMMQEQKQIETKYQIKRKMR